ncbi:helix-turn-helix transcriptional regulator [Streptomyces nojiriensis]|uniref:helix-turn-helix transcriptional regulator n=1 Tax=Streptomyces nojiriensis TaxID=66374 RepID=UPI002E17F3AE
MTARPTLTRRQREVLLLAANGNTNAQIARWLGVTPNSVAEVLAKAYRALGVADRAQAVAVSLRLELLDMDAVFLPAAFGLEVQHRHEGRQKLPVS